MTATPNPANPFGANVASYEDAAERIRDLSERLISSSQVAGNTGLDAFEKAVESMVGLEEKMAGASQLEWVSAIAQSHASVVRDMTAAYTKAAREMLSAGR